MITDEKIDEIAKKFWASLRTTRDLRDALRSAALAQPASADVAPATQGDPKRKRCMCCGAELTDDETLDHGCGMGFSTIATPAVTEMPSREQLAAARATELHDGKTAWATKRNRILAALHASRERDKGEIERLAKERDEARERGQMWHDRRKASEVERDALTAQLKEARGIAEEAAELLVWASWLQSVSPKARKEIEEVVTKLRNFAPPAPQPQQQP